ncbi:hypothetical protein BYT27DRAFT_7343491 [Phlegmacium glaucopus]|nr:hypothetical protein BYT27DRAFT_7343491 [Phlegmacium glaucopus]
MAIYLKAAEDRTASAQPIGFTRYVDETLNRCQNETAIVEMKINLLKARPSRPEGNTTCANNLTTTVANQTNNVDTAGIFIILWTFTGITASKDPVEVGVVTEFGIERRFE